MKKRFDINCPYCKTPMKCSKSMFHEMGLLDMGGGSCIECKKVFEIHYHPDSNSMTTHIIDLGGDEHE